MTKYFVLCENEKKPLKKFKREYEAIAFASDFRNLSEHGCMTVVMDTDADGRFVWDHDAGAWQRLKEDVS